MNYKALFLDVDDTLVVHGLDSLPSPRVAQAIAALKRKNVFVCLATSRPLHVAINIIDHLDMTGLCVISGGAQIYDPVQKKMVREILLPKAAVPTVVSLAEREMLKIGYFDGEKDRLLPDRSLPETDHIIGMYLPEVNLAQVDDIEKKLRELEKVAVHRMLSWDKQFAWFDITHRESTKLHGIKAVSRMLGLKPSEIVGVGDGYNDFPLLKASGLKVAMGNAVPELKRMADFIAPSIDEDGVAAVIEKFFLS